ncbi:hypothetical protein Q2T40_18495 [Winogradskyella maritima]|uniref:Uncharacterized protein n=1 Tax=Winogradskyella maritima TaxID=1517766 RepID=A0ABV8AF43_9FLAO|nr:hypothetical protein [Winogradskyella maritima]
MKLFLRHLGESLRSYPQIRFTKNDEILIRDSAISHLGHDNLNQLRDRFEGQAFFEKTMRNIGGLMALQKHLKVSPFDFNNANLKDFLPYIKVDGQRIDINVFEFGQLPMVKVKEVNNPIYFIIQKDSLTFLLCGYAPKTVVNEHLVETLVETSSTDELMEFVGFQHLQQIED